MARISDITSTDKLLRVIRRKTQEPLDDFDLAVTPSKKTRRFALPSFSLQKSSAIGVDIGDSFIRLVRIAERGRGNRQVLDRRRLAIPPDTPRNTAEFAAFLKSALGSAFGSAKQSRLWVMMPSDSVEVRNITIPKVPKRQLGNVVYWTVKKETPFDEKEMILDFEIQGETIDQGTPKLVALVFTAPRQEIEDLRTLFSRIGWPLTGITTASFSVQNLFRTQWIPSFGTGIASLFIGTDFCRIDIFSGGNLIVTRGIKAGLNSLTDALAEGLNAVKAGLVPPAPTPEQSLKILQSLDADCQPLAETDVGFGLGKEAIFEMVKPALERMARQLLRTFEHHATTTPDIEIGRIYISSAITLSQPIVEYMGSQLGIATTQLDPLSEEELSACPDVDDRRSVSERIAFGAALGLALSDNGRTPNLIFTYKDKEREASVRRINRAVLAVFIALVLLCSAVFVYQSHTIDGNKESLAALRLKLAETGPPVDRNQIVKLAAAVKARGALSKLYADRYLGMVLISELAAQTPAHIRFTNLKIALGPPSAEPAAKKDAPKPRTEEVTIEGLILGDRQIFETSLAAYTMALEASPLFKQVSITKNSVEPHLKGEALHFILNMKVEEQVHG